MMVSMKTLNIALNNAAHEKLHVIKEKLGFRNLSDTIAYLVQHCETTVMREQLRKGD
jgi:hypothetical protein